MRNPCLAMNHFVSHNGVTVAVRSPQVVQGWEKSDRIGRNTTDETVVMPDVEFAARAIIVDRPLTPKLAGWILPFF